MNVKNKLNQEMVVVANDLIKLDNFNIVTNNGPYNDVELPLRFNCHLLIIGCYLVKNNFLDRVSISHIESFFTEILKEKSRFNYKSRESFASRRDTVNGLMGPAWIAESLIYAGKTIGRSDFTKEAVRLLKCHPFDHQNKCWHRITPCGMLLTIDYTFNHQLWFCEQCLKTGDDELTKLANTFLEFHIPRLKINASGVIHHYSPMVKLVKKPSLGHVIDVYYAFGQYLTSTSPQAEKSVAYQGFNLKALAGCFSLSRQLNCWISPNFHKLKNFKFNPKVDGQLKDSCYGYQYNPSIYEFLFWFKLCDPKKAKVFEKFVEDEVEIGCDRTPLDNVMQKLRIYEAISYLELDENS